jgi:hypothetical protein
MIWALALVVDKPSSFGAWVDAQGAQQSIQQQKHHGE